MARAKITGYVELEDDELDPDDPTGVTSEAFDAIHELDVQTLEDVSIRVVD